MNYLGIKLTKEVKDIYNEITKLLKMEINTLESGGTSHSHG